MLPRGALSLNYGGISGSEGGLLLLTSKDSSFVILEKMILSFSKSLYVCF